VICRRDRLISTRQSQCLSRQRLASEASAILRPGSISCLCLSALQFTVVAASSIAPGSAKKVRSLLIPRLPNCRGIRWPLEWVRPSGDEGGRNIVPVAVSLLDRMCWRQARRCEPDRRSSSAQHQDEKEGDQGRAHPRRLERQAAKLRRRIGRALDSQIHQGKPREDGSTPPVDLAIPVFGIRTHLARIAVLGSFANGRDGHRCL